MNYSLLPRLAALADLSSLFTSSETMAVDMARQSLAIKLRSATSGMTAPFDT